MSYGYCDTIMTSSLFDVQGLNYVRLVRIQKFAKPKTLPAHCLGHHKVILLCLNTDVTRVTEPLST